MNKISLSNLMQYIKRDKHYLEVFNELQGLYKLYQETDDPQKFEYVPVKIVASFQEFFRGKYKEIMDDPRFRGRIKDVKALKNVDYDFEVLGAFQDNELTLGDYLSYLIPCSSIEVIHNTLSQLLDIDFLGKLKEINGDTSGLLKSINDIFKLRHMYCHEIPSTDNLDYNRIVIFVNDACDFLSLADGIILEGQFPESANTTIEMIDEINSEFDKADKDLSLLIDQIKAQRTDGDLFSNNLDYIEEWKQYRSSKAKSEASLSEGGTIYPIIYTQSMLKTTKTLIKELKEEYKYLLRR